MNIALKKNRKTIQVGESMTAYEYPVMDKKIHGAVVVLNGRYPEKGSVGNEKCTEIGYVIKGSGKLVVEDKEILFEEGDQLLIESGEKYFWNGKATIFMPCAPAWYPEQHREVK